MGGLSDDNSGGRGGRSVVASPRPRRDCTRAQRLGLSERSRSSSPQAETLPQPSHCRRLSRFPSYQRCVAEWRGPTCDVVGENLSESTFMNISITFDVGYRDEY